MDKLIINGEECREILGFEKYSISEFGRIYRYASAKRNIRNGGLFSNESKVHFRIYKGKLRQGFASLTDTKGKLHNVAVAPLVAIAFGLLPEGINKKKQEINYRDDNKKNLHYTNLVVTKRKYSNSKLNDEDVKHIKKYIKNGLSLRYIGRVFGVSEMQINRIKTGENWGNGKRKIKVPVAPFEIKDGRMRKYIATFDKKKTVNGIRKNFAVKRNADEPTDNLIIGIVNGYKLSLKHTNITRAEYIIEKLNDYFFDSKTKKELNTLPNKR